MHTGRGWLRRVAAAAAALALAVTEAPAGEPHEEEPVRLPPVTVTAPPDAALKGEIEERIKETKSTTAVSGGDLREFNPANAFDALRLVPGVNFLFGGGTRNATPTTIRGASGFPTPKVIDGFPSIRETGTGSDFSPTGFANPGFSIPSIAIESVEVVKGSQGVLYGEAAEGGVFVTRLKRGRPGPATGSLYGEGTTLPESLFMADVGGGGPDFDYYFAGKRYDLHGEGWTENNTRLLDRAQTSGLGKFGWTPSAGSRVEMVAIGGTDRIEGVDTAGTEPFDRQTSNLFFGLRADRQLTDRLAYQVGYSYWFEELAFETRPQVTFESTRTGENHLPFASVHLKTPLSERWRHGASIGVEYARATIEQRSSATGGSRSDKDFAFDDLSVYHVQQLSYLQRLFLNAGVRYAYFLEDFGDQDAVSYEAGAAWVLPWTATKLRASLSTGFSRNTGSVFSLSPVGEPLNLERAGATETTTWEVGLEQPFLENRVRLEVTYFQLDKDGQPRTVSSGGTTFLVNDDDSLRKGVEVLAETRPLDSVRLVGSFAYIDTEIRASETRPDLVGLDAMPISKVTAGVGAEWLPAPRLRIGTLAVYQSDQEQDRPQGGQIVTTTRPAFWRWNAYAEYALTRALHLGARVENILDERDPAISTDRSTGVSTQAGEDPGTLLALSVRYLW